MRLFLSAIAALLLMITLAVPILTAAPPDPVMTAVSRSAPFSCWFYCQPGLCIAGHQFNCKCGPPVAPNKWCGQQDQGPEIVCCQRSSYMATEGAVVGRTAVLLAEDRGVLKRGDILISNCGSVTAIESGLKQVDPEASVKFYVIRGDSTWSIQTTGAYIKGAITDRGFVVDRTGTDLTALEKYHEGDFVSIVGVDENRLVQRGGMVYKDGVAAPGILSYARLPMMELTLDRSGNRIWYSPGGDKLASLR